MKIEAIETIHIGIPYTTGGSADAEAWGGKAWATAEALLVKITTDAGIVGWGEAFGYNVIPATRAAIDQMVAPLCIGRDPLQIESLMLELQQKLHVFGRGGAVIYALSGIDVALWDIAGKAAGVPLHRLLGGARAVRLPAYASLIRYTKPEVVAANVVRAAGHGFRHVKLHEIEVPAVCAAREAAGEAVDLMLDVNCPWSRHEALDMAARLRPYDLMWPPEDYAGLAQVCAQGGIPVAAGENAASLMQFQHLFAAGAIDYAQPSLLKIGGVTEFRKLFALAAAHGVTVMPHSFYDGPGLLAAIHVIATLGQGSLVEWRYFDLEARLYGDRFVPKDGSIDVPQGPGLGADPDAEVVRRYRVA
jgi:L-alanine-DL-glutamate epimerase-like enolase superfamily enzyme